MPLLDIDALLEPILGDDPAGWPVPYMLRAQLEEARKESGPADLPPEDRAAQTRPVDWSALVRTTQEILSTQSKDLLVAARLTEALTCEHGFAGLAEGLVLLRRLFEECWSRLHPSIDDGDLEVRAAPLNWLSEADRGARFPSTIRNLPLVRGSNQSLSWLDWRRSQDGHGPVDAKAFDEVVLQASREECYRLTLDLQRAATEHAALLAVVNQRLADAAPSMEGLSNALNDCRILSEQILARKGGPPALEGDAGETADPCDAQAVEGGVVSQAASGQTHDYRRAALARNDAYRRLAEVGEELRILEPHSPVPVMIQTAVKWGNLSFPELIRIMVQEEGLMGMLSRQSETGAEEEALQDS
jgi:type VI secretion system protein ImpA